jgi:tetratricopeptide (TPR) repeat protein
VRAFVFAYLRLRRTQVWLVCLAALAGVLAYTPLFNLLGYEFCLAIAVAGSVAAAHLGSVQVTVARKRDLGMMLSLSTPLRALTSVLGRCVAANLLLLVLPLGIVSLNALRVKNCDYLEGLAFFAMMPMLSVILASCVGALWALAVPRGALATLGALLTLVGSVVWGLWRFYDGPPIFGYDPFVGYFPGALYDENVAIRLPFLLFRAYNLVWLAAFVSVALHFFDPLTLRLRLSRLGTTGGRLTTVAALLVAAGMVLFWLRAALGFAVDAPYIHAELGGVRHTSHFTIHHPREMEPDEVDLLVEDHEFRYAQLAALFGTAPERITSYIFRSGDEKQRLMGAGHTFVAKPWREEVYLHKARFPHRVLKHELAHVFAGLHGDAMFGVSLRWRRKPLLHPVFNVGLIEGVAVAADWRPYLDEMDGHQMAAALVKLELAPAIETLFGYGFLAGSASRSYVLAGSFCRLLLDRYGIARLVAVFENGGDFKAAYGRPLRVLAEEWSRFIAEVEVPDRQLQLASERFRRPSILRRVCSHEVANLIEESSRLRQRQKPDEAVRVLERVCRFDPGEPRHLLRWMRGTAEAGRLKDALSIGQRLLRHPSLSKPMRRETLELAGDYRWLAGDLAAAAQDYKRAAENAAPPFGRRVLHLKRWALRQPEPVRRLVRRYLIPPPGTKREAGLDVHLAYSIFGRSAPARGGASPLSARKYLSPAHRRGIGKRGIGMFLVGKQLAARRHFDDAAGAITEALDLGLPNRDFVVDAHLLLLRCRYASRRNDEALATLKRLSAMHDLPAGIRLQVSDWLERVRWRTGDTSSHNTQ